MPQLLRYCQLKKENNTMKTFSMKYHLFSTHFINEIYLYKKSIELKSCIIEKKVAVGLK